MGTLEYMAPEQARGGYLNAATDVRGIGAVLFEDTTGEPPFDAYDEEDRYEQLERRAEPVRLYRRVPAAFNDVVGSCLEHEPFRRPAVGELTAGLNQMIRDPGARTAPKLGPLLTITTSRGRKERGLGFTSPLSQPMRRGMDSPLSLA